MQLKLKKVEMAIYALFFALFKIYIIPQILQQTLKIILLVYVFIFLLKNIRINNIYNATIPFGISIILSGIISHVNGQVGLQSIYNGILHVLCLYLTFMLVRYCKEHKYYEILTSCLFRITTLYCILSFFSMIALGHSDVGTEITYFFGYKFMTSYYFILGIALFRIKYYKRLKRYKRYEIAYFILSACTLFICRWLYCSTAMVASLLLLIVPFVSRRTKKIAMNPLAVILFIILAGLLPFAIELIMKISFVQHVVADILHKSLNLTGRVKIYAFLEQIISERSLFGYGYGNVAVERVVGYGNAQNGLMQLIVDYGLIGAALFFILVYSCLRKRKISESLEGFYMVLYIMIICSTVEISYNYIFYMVLFVIGCFSDEQEYSNEVLEDVYRRNKKIKKRKGSQDENRNIIYAKG